jgi:hypothetical protein
MIDVYPSFKNKEVRKKYSEKINNIFKQNKFDWDVCSAIDSSYIFVKPNIYPLKLNTEYHPFQNVVKISVHSKEGIVCLGIISYPTMEDSGQEKILQSKGYAHEKFENQPEMFLLTKPLNTLESLVEELKDIEFVLLKK